MATPKKSQAKKQRDEFDRLVAKLGVKKAAFTSGQSVVVQTKHPASKS